MRLTPQRTTGWKLNGAAAFVLAAAAVSVLMTGRLCAGQTAAVQKPAPAAVPKATAEGNAAVAKNAVPEPGVVLDRLVAVVNGDVILESDVDEERRFEEVQPYRTAPTFSRERIVERLVDRELILQQSELEPHEAVSEKDLDDQIATLRKDIPACKQYHCETEDGWKKYLGDHGFAEGEFRARWKQRMRLLKFIEVRFRSGITITNSEIQAYYDKTMLPEYAQRNITPPKLDSIQPRIEEVLLQQQVGALLQDWLKSLRAQGSVQIITPGEVMQ